MIFKHLYGGEIDWLLMAKSFSEYNTPTAFDSVWLSKIGDKPFTVVAVEQGTHSKKTKVRVKQPDNTYKDEYETEEVPKIVITTKEKFKIDGTEYSKLASTSPAIISALTTDQVLQDLADGEEIGQVKCVLEGKPKNGGNPYNILVSA